MALYKIRWKKSAVKELKKIDTKAIPRILSTVEKLSKNPYPSGVKKLIGTQYSYRIRVGNYRVVYDIFESTLIIEIVRVRHKKDVYE